MRRAHLKYVDAGCACQHKADLKMYRAQMEGIKASYDELLNYCSKTRRDVSEFAVALHQARKQHQDLIHDYDFQESRMLRQKRGLELQIHGRDLFTQHVIKSFKKKSVTALARVSAGYGAAFRLELEQRASQQFADKCFQIQGELEEAEARLKKTERRWQKARYLSSLVSDISVFAERGKLSLDQFLSDQNEMGLKRWDEILAYKRSKVASQGLKILICDSCNGWRWNDPKLPLV